MEAAWSKKIILCQLTMCYPCVNVRSGWHGAENSEMKLQNFIILRA